MGERFQRFMDWMDTPTSRDLRMEDELIRRKREELAELEARRVRGQWLHDRKRRKVGSGR